MIRPKNGSLPAFVSLIVTTCLLLLLPGCSRCGAAPTGRMHVAVSVFPIYDLVRTVAGPDADVHLLLPAGHNEHHFDPTPKDVADAAKAQLFVMVGLGLDGWMEKLAKDSAPKARVLKVGDRVPTRPMPEMLAEAEAHANAPDDDDDHHGNTDPHVWLDPSRVRLMVKSIAEELAKQDSAHAAAYRERAGAFDTALATLDAEAEKRTKALSRRGFVTFHGSFGYFAERYKLDILAVIEPYPGSQPSSAYLKKVMAVVKEKSVPALYSEPQLDARPAQVLADEAKIPLGTLDPVGGGPEADTYEKLIHFNLTALEKHLR